MQNKNNYQVRKCITIQEVTFHQIILLSEYQVISRCNQRTINTKMVSIKLLMQPNFLNTFFKFIVILLLVSIGLNMHSLPKYSTSQHTHFQKDLSVLLRCLKFHATSGAGEVLDSETCRRIAKFTEYRDANDINMSPNNVKKPKGCYDNLEISSSRQNPVPNATNWYVDSDGYLDAFSYCGHTPKLVSHQSVYIADDRLPIPNVVHYIWFYNIPDPPDFELKFTQYMSIYSVNKFIKPRYILWHGNIVPKGYWWERTVKEVPNIYFVKWKIPHSIYGIPLGKIYHSSDVLRLWILIVHGGMYIDEDCLVLKSFDPLRKHDVVLGRELRYTLANGVILAKPWAFFLRLWMNGYLKFNMVNWSKYSMLLPNKLSIVFPDDVHIENRNLIYPTWPHIEKLYWNNFDWKPNYSIHLYGHHKWRFNKDMPNNTQEMDVSKITIGAIMRYIYYGNERPRV